MDAEITKRVNSALATYSAAVGRKKTAIAANVKATNDFDEADATQKILQAVAKTVQQQAHNRIAAVVGRCLTAVFDEPYAFHIEFEQKRGRTEATLSFIREGKSIDPMSASGGGVVDVAAFALRLASLLLSRPQKRRLMIMDEPMRFVSAEYRGRVSLLMRELAKEMGMQFIIVTHMVELQGDKAIELR